MLRITKFRLLKQVVGNFKGPSFSSFNNFDQFNQDLYDNCPPAIQEHIALHQNLTLAVIDRMSEMESNNIDSMFFLNKKDKRAKVKRRSRKHGHLKRPKAHQNH